MARLPVLALLALAFFACRGPKGSPDSSVKSFFSAAEARDWEAMVDTISEASLKRLGSRPRAMAIFARDFDGWKDVTVTIDEEFIDASGKAATVHFSCVATQLENYKRLQFDCSDVFALVKESDGKWHITLPGTTRLRPM